MVTCAKTLGQVTEILALAVHPGADVDARKLHHTLSLEAKQDRHPLSSKGVGTHEPEVPVEQKFSLVGLQVKQMGLRGQSTRFLAGLTPKFPPVITTSLPPTVGPLRRGNLDMVEGNTRVLVDAPDTVKVAVAEKKGES